MADTKSIYIGNSKNEPVRANIITVGLDNSIPRRIQAIYVGDENNEPKEVFRNELIVRSLISKVEHHTYSWGGITKDFATTKVESGHRYLVKNYTNFWPSGYSEQFGLYDQYSQGTFGFYYSSGSGEGYVPGGSLTLGANMHRSASGNTSTIWTAPNSTTKIFWRNEMGHGYPEASPNMCNFTSASNCSYFIDLTEIEAIHGKFSSASAAIAFIGTPSYVDGAWQWTLFS